MSTRRGSPLPPDVEAALRELNNALGKATMYPAGHGLVVKAAASLAERLGDALESRASVLLGITPRGLLLDGIVAEPLAPLLRDLAARLHRKNVGTVHLVAGVGPDEVSALLQELARGDADESIGREGLRLPHLRVEPLVYDVVAFAEANDELDDVFWTRLVEAAFGRRLAEGEKVPTAAELAAAIEEGVDRSADSPRRIYEALAAFSSALAGRGERAATNARRRFVEVLSALSRPTTSRVLIAAPSATARRRFLRETLEQVPPALLLQLLEAVAEADGEPISPHLRWMLGKLAGAEGEQKGLPTGAFASQVLGLLEHWEGGDLDDTPADPRMAADGMRIVTLGLELAVHTPPVVEAARREALAGRLGEVLGAVDHPANARPTAEAISRAALDPGLLGQLLRTADPDWGLVERIARHQPAAAVEPLLDALGRAEERTVRRRLLDLLGGLGAAAEPTLVGRLANAPWYLARNILSALGQLPALSEPAPVLAMLEHPELRVRQEALKVLVRQAATREDAVVTALDSGEPALVRTALAALDGECPPRIVAPLLGLLVEADDETRLHAIRLLEEVENPLVVGPLLALVRTRGGLLRRWRLLPPTPVMLAALGLLVRRWPTHRPVVLALQLAQRSSDPRVQDALGILGGGYR